MSLPTQTLKRWREDAERLVKRWINSRVVNKERLKQLLKDFDKQPLLSQPFPEQSEDVLDDMLFDSSLVHADIVRCRELHSLLQRIAQELR